jgi:hypothetical protein
MKKLLAVILVGVLTFSLTGCNGPAVEAIIADIGQTIISILSIEGKLSATTQAQVNAAAALAEKDYAAVEAAPLSERATNLATFQLDWGAFQNLVQPILSDANASPVLQDVVQITLAQVASVTAIVAANSSASLASGSSSVLSEKDFRTQVNVKLKRFGKKINGPTNRRVKKVVKFWRW